MRTNNFMKNYSFKKYAFVLPLVLLCGCAASDKIQEEVVLNVADVYTYQMPEPVNFKLDKRATFEINTANLTETGKESLAAIARELKNYPEATITVTGHTDTTGPDEFNNNLSALRATAVKNALIEEYGLQNRVETLGKGSSEPLEDNETLSGRRANRRVEVTVQE